MGFIQAAMASASGNLAEQWKEMLYCDSIDKDTLVVKGQKRSNSRTANVKGDDNLISNGSLVIVNNGQCMIIVEQGKVVDLCAEPGEFVYDSSLTPSVFAGSLGSSVIDTFKNIGKRFTFGGDTGADQRVYYFNTKEIMGNKFGTPNPIPFRVVDNNIGLDIDISVRCNGEYSYKIVDPLLFYTNVCGNVSESYNRSEIASQLKSELLTALQPAFARISAEGIRYSAVPAHTDKVAEALNEILSNKWAELRGITISSFGVNTIAADEEDEDMIKQLQKSAVMRDPTMAAAVLSGAQAEAMVGAANNTSSGGAFMAFAGMNMANNAGGMNANNLYQMGQQQQMGQPMGQPYPNQQMGQQPYDNQQYMNQQQMGQQYPNQQMGQQQYGNQQPMAQEEPQQAAAAAAVATGWACACGTTNEGKFCRECGSPKPAQARYRCDKCGWVPEDQSVPPKFCPECGDRFDESDFA